MKRHFALLASALLATILSPSGARAAAVSFGFSGVVDRVLNPSNAAPADLVAGLPFTGILTYDSALLLGPDTDPDSQYGAYYFTNEIGLSMVVQIGNHTFTCSNPVPGEIFAGITVYNGGNDEDSLDYFFGFQALCLDGSRLPGSYNQGGISLYFADDSKTALPTDALPTTMPQLGAFSSSQSLTISAYQYGTESSLLYLEGTVTNLTSIPRPQLAIRQRPDTSLVLSWPLAAQGFMLETTSDVVAGPWQSVLLPVVSTATEYTVSLPAPAAPKYFRLTHP